MDLETDEVLVERTCELARTHGFRGALSIDFAPDGEQLAVAYGSSTLALHDPATLEEMGRLVDHTGAVFSVCFFPDGKRVASGGRDGVLRLWDPEGGALLLRLESHEDYIYSLDVSPDGTRILTGSGDRSVQLWESRRSAHLWPDYVAAHEQ